MKENTCKKKQGSSSSLETHFLITMNKLEQRYICTIIIIPNRKIHLKKINLLKEKRVLICKTLHAMNLHCSMYNKLWIVPSLATVGLVVVEDF